MNNLAFCVKIMQTMANSFDNLISHMPLDPMGFSCIGKKFVRSPTCSSGTAAVNIYLKRKVNKITVLGNILLDTN
jgi:hypothetical protein